MLFRIYQKDVWMIHCILDLDQFSAHMHSMWTDEIASAEMNWLIVSPETLQRAEKSTMMPPGFPLNSKS